jgi:hypothetical protein
MSARVCWAAGILMLAGGAGAAEEALRLKAPGEVWVSPLNAPALLSTQAATLRSSLQPEGLALAAFDRRLDQGCEIRTAATLALAFRRPQSLHEVRVLTAGGACEWSLSTGDSLTALEQGAGSTRVLVPPRQRLAGGAWDEVKLPQPTPVTAVRLNVRPTGASPVQLQECNLLVEQTLTGITLTSTRSVILRDDPVYLSIRGRFSGGEERLIDARELKFTIAPPNYARVDSKGRIIATRKGSIGVVAQWDRLTSPPLLLEVDDD